jgi:hypothetical protein
MIRHDPKALAVGARILRPDVPGFGGALASRRRRHISDDMNAIALRPSFIEMRLLILLGLLPALAVALAVAVWPFEASRDCRGSFSPGFSSDFDRHRCDLVVRKIGTDAKIRVPLPQ